MCTTYQTHYTRCERKGYGRGLKGDLPCTDEYMDECRNAQKIDETCAAPTIKCRWIDFECGKHGGPSPCEREKMIKERKGQGKEEGTWVKKKDMRSECDAMFCTIQ
ncbi:hypothetical protein COCMIDRAFT_79522 [Bipolaris oryzae ATCC 44560]|uniref:Uncharacterized protein n=1 Tax=Bipolaris oryzae ATCC 44560 TaxID=930090 RepID=W6ZUP9_COCMI|nr:uncharacterized protein COCMIDRAFT_79522 [Bipolaris oryzae ATCC 44560]EUC51289.1 hypothetical protein COCMIDRAFT_79522 [Bipolaris oryzae ATCC 44560]